MGNRNAVRERVVVHKVLWLGKLQQKKKKSSGGESKQAWKYEQSREIKKLGFAQTIHSMRIPRHHHPPKRKGTPPQTKKVLLFSDASKLEYESTNAPLF